jgi:Ca-activated chloride channel homolog
MKRSRRTFVAILAAAGATAGALYVFGLKGGLPGGFPGGLLPSEPVRISIASSVTKQNWLKAATDSFAAADIRTASGAPIQIDIASVLSGESMLQIADGTLQPTIWRPGETAWVDQLDERWGRSNPQPIRSGPCAPTVLTPVGLAMWRPKAEALG